MTFQPCGEKEPSTKSSESGLGDRWVCFKVGSLQDEMNTFDHQHVFKYYIKRVSVRSTELHTSLQRKVQPWQMQRLILALQQLSVVAVRVNASNRSNTRTNGEQIMIMFANR